MSQFRRVYRATVGTIRVSAPMRVGFEIERSIHPTPGKATLRLWNLTRDHQTEIEQAAAAQVIVEVGHADDRGLETIFSGGLFRAHGAIRTETEGVDAVTHVEARDGGRQFRGARIEQSFDRGVSVDTVVRACARSLGVGAGNVDAIASAAQLSNGSTAFPEGTVLSGPAALELTRVLASLGLRWSIQHGALQIQRRGEPLATQAVRLTPKTGLLGAPVVGTRGRVKAVALITPDLWPGRAVVLESERVEGRFLIQSAKYTGDSHTNDWHVEMELAP